MSHPHHLEVNRYETMVEALMALQEKGYTNTFKVTSDSAKCIETSDLLLAEELTITEFHRFEGDSNPGDMSVVYVVEGPNHIKGTIVDAFGTYANIEIAEFIENAHWPDKTPDINAA